MKKLTDLDVSGKRVFLRADLDVNIANAKSEILNSKTEETATRLTNLKPTIDYLIKEGARQVIIAGHIDRPSPRLQNGKPEIDPTKSTKQLLPILEKVLGRTIVFNPELTVHSLLSTDNQILLLENLRFWPGEVENDISFAKKLAELADCYVNEAFGNSHRNHASMVALPNFYQHVEDPERSRRAAGLHLQKEVEEFERVLKNPQKPLVAIVGGAKLETKIPVIENLSRVADRVLVGGYLPVEIAKEALKFAENVYIASLTEDTKDISQESRSRFLETIRGAKTVVWNGPLGLFEGGYTAGSFEVAKAVLDCGSYSIVGGGETTQFLANENLLSKFSFVSSGGGAMLEFLAGKILPGVTALE